MTNHLVDGCRLPDEVAGHPALELCNTKALWGQPVENEYLVDFRTVAVWAREQSLLSAQECARVATLSEAQQLTALRQVISLRNALYAAATVDRSRLAEIHGFVARAVGRASYADAGVVQELQAAYGPSVVVDRCALAVHRLLVDYGLDAVGRCADPVCGWVFLDPTHRRRWCTMAVCGNRAKARRHAARTRTPAPTPAPARPLR